MSNYKYEGYGVIRDLKDDIPYPTDDIVDLLDEKDQQIKELEEKEKGNKQLAIEELEKLKNFFLKPYKDEEMDTDFLITKDEGSIADYILDRIKELRGE